MWIKIGVWILWYVSMCFVSFYCRLFGVGAETKGSDEDDGRKNLRLVKTERKKKHSFALRKIKTTTEKYWDTECVCAHADKESFNEMWELHNLHTHTHDIFIVVVFLLYIKSKLNVMCTHSVYVYAPRSNFSLCAYPLFPIWYSKNWGKYRTKKKIPLRMYTHGQIIRKENEIKMKEINGNWRNRNQSIETIKQHERILLPFSCGWLLVFFVLCSVIMFCIYIM